MKKLEKLSEEQKQHLKVNKDRFIKLFLNNEKINEKIAEEVVENIEKEQEKIKEFLKERDKIADGKWIKKGD